MEEFLEDIVQTEFNVSFEDDSIREVSDKVCEFYTICSSETEEVIKEKLVTLPRCDLSKCQVAGDDDMETEDNEAGENLNKIDDLHISESKRNEPEIDEDGFEMVKPRRNK